MRASVPLDSRVPPGYHRRMSIEIKALAPELLDDYLAFFDSVAFTDNPDWSGCYCCFYHHDPREAPFESQSAAHQYHGPFELYRKEGFVVHRELEGSWIVRKALGARA